MNAIVQTGLGAALAAFSFGVLFNIHGKKLWASALISFVAGCVFQTVQDAGMNELAQYFLAGLTFSALSELAARLLKSPATPFLAANLIPFVPGGTMYYMMAAMVEGQNGTALSDFTEVLTISGLLALAILVSHTLAKLIVYAKRKI